MKWHEVFENQQEIYRDVAVTWSELWLKLERDVVSNRYLQLKFDRHSMFASFPPSRKKLNCSCKVQAWRDDSSFLVEKVGGGRSSSCTNQGSIAVPECYSKRIFLFPFRWTRVTRALGTRLDKKAKGLGSRCKRLCWHRPKCRLNR